MIYATGTPDGVPVCMSSFRSVGDGVPDVPSPRQRYAVTRPPTLFFIYYHVFPPLGTFPPCFPLTSMV